MFDDPQYVNTPRLVYGDNMVFLRICPNCGRFVNADKTVFSRHNPDKGIEFKLNATCKKCGRVEMPFEGYF